MLIGNLFTFHVFLANLYILLCMILRVNIDIYIYIIFLGIYKNISSVLVYLLKVDIKKIN